MCLCILSVTEIPLTIHPSLRGAFRETEDLDHGRGAGSPPNPPSDSSAWRGGAEGSAATGNGRSYPRRASDRWVSGAWQLRRPNIFGCFCMRVPVPQARSPTLFADCTSFPPSSLQIKGEADGDAVLCTRDSTFVLKTVGTTNTIYLARDEQVCAPPLFVGLQMARHGSDAHLQCSTLGWGVHQVTVLLYPHCVDCPRSPWIPLDDDTGDIGGAHAEFNTLSTNSSQSNGRAGHTEGKGACGIDLALTAAAVVEWVSFRCMKGFSLLG